MRSANDASQPSTAEAGSVGGTSVSGQEGVTAVNSGISSRPVSAESQSFSFSMSFSELRPCEQGSLSLTCIFIMVICLK